VFAEGKQEGRQEGRQESHQELVLRLLRRRLGTLDPDPEARIQQLSVADLEALADALLDFHTADELRVWLNRH